MQILVMNNGLKAADTLDEINYAESITADENGHVVTVTSDGSMFLLKEGKILSTIRLKDTEEEFNSCAFAPDGTLMAGTSKDHIYRYVIASGDFVQKDAITCDDVSNINDLYYINDGTLFMLQTVAYPTWTDRAIIA